MHLIVSVSGTSNRLELERTASGWHCRLNRREISLDVVEIATGRLSILINGKSYDVVRGAGDTLAVGERTYEVSVADPRSWRSRQQDASGASGPQKLAASMPGKIIRVLTSPGKKIAAGEGLVVIEAMKMQNEIRSPRDGTVTSILVKEGTNVNAGEIVAVVE